MVASLCLCSDGTPVVTGKKGTLKRKTQIQDLIQSSEMGYSDDLLDLTPFREKTLRVPVSSTGHANGACFCACVFTANIGWDDLRPAQGSGLGVVN